MGSLRRTMSRAMARMPSPWPSLPFIDVGGDRHHGPRSVGPKPGLAADYASIELRMMTTFGAVAAVCPVCGQTVWGMGDYLGRGKPTEESLILSHARKERDSRHGVLYVMSA